MYNGYDPSHICYKWLYNKRNGYTLKEIPEWEQLDGVVGGDAEHAKMQEPSNTAPVNSNSDYDCKSCKCLDTNAGKICGRVSRADGFVKKCSSECSKCDGCYGEKDYNVVGSNSNDGNYLTIEANSNLDKVIINNIKNSDLNDIIEN